MDIFGGLIVSPQLSIGLCSISVIIMVLGAHRVVIILGWIVALVAAVVAFPFDMFAVVVVAMIGLWTIFYQLMGYQWFPVLRWRHAHLH